MNPTIDTGPESVRQGAALETDTDRICAKIDRAIDGAQALWARVNAAEACAAVLLEALQRIAELSPEAANAATPRALRIVAAFARTAIAEALATPSEHSAEISKGEG